MEFIINLQNSGKFLHQGTHQSKLLESANSEAFAWCITSPHSPNFGELWEDGRHCMQYHLKEIGRVQSIYFQKTKHSPDSSRGMSCSHPLTAFFSDPNDFTFLSVGQFLNGAPESNLSDLSVSCLYRWKHLQRIQQLFWKR